MCRKESEKGIQSTEKGRCGGAEVEYWLLSVGTGLASWWQWAKSTQLLRSGLWPVCWCIKTFPLMPVNPNPVKRGVMCLRVKSGTVLFGRMWGESLPLGWRGHRNGAWGRPAYLLQHPCQIITPICSWPFFFVTLNTPTSVLHTTGFQDSSAPCSPSSKCGPLWIL